MATRGRVGLELSDGSILSIYSHWDNYPSWAGRILRTHYNTREKVEALIDGGDVSVLWTKELWTGKELAPHVVEIQEVEEYGPRRYSERGEDCPPRLDENLKQFIENGEEYGYIFRNGEWICYNTRSWDDNYGKEETIPEGELAV